MLIRYHLDIETQGVPLQIISNKNRFMMYERQTSKFKAVQLSGKASVTYQVKIKYNWDQMLIY